MIALHGLWAQGRLYLWGEDSDAAERCLNSAPPADVHGAPDGRPHPFAVPAGTLRRIAGDAWDGLLAAGAADTRAQLQLPTITAGAPMPTPSTSLNTNGPAAPQSSADTIALWSVPCLSFSATDGLDLLVSFPTQYAGRLAVGDSLRFWSKLASLLLDALAAQRFVPDVVADGDGRHRALWRLVLHETGGSDQLTAAAACMPPVCRCASASPDGLDARALVEDFFATTADAEVRRILSDDPLVVSLDEDNSAEARPEVLWLRGLVGGDSRIGGSAETRADLANRVRCWVGRLDDAAGHTEFRTCFRLHSPDMPTDDESADDEAEWKVSFHLQALDDPQVILEAGKVWSLRKRMALLPEHAVGGLHEQLESDLRRAAHFFTPLSDVLDRPDSPQPVEVWIDTDGAYSFIRECAPLLEMNGFGVTLPDWCTSRRRRLGLRLQLDPASRGDVGKQQLGLDALVDYHWKVALGDDVLSDDEFRRLAAGTRNLVRLRGEWISVDRGVLSNAVNALRHRPGDPITVFEALRMSVGFGSQGKHVGLPVAGIDASDWIEAALNSVGDNDQTIRDLSQPVSFHGELRPYQVKGLSWLAFLDRFGLGGCLADDMGLGKTIQLIALLLHERLEGAAPGPSLLVVPMSLVGNWQRELNRFAPALGVMIHHGAERLSGDAFVGEVAHHDVVISTYALVHRDFDHLAKVRWHRVVLDEAQNIKNPSAKQTKALKRLECRRRLALTGTPLENHLTELWSIFEFLNPGLLGTATEFRRLFAVPIEKHRHADRSRQLRRLIRPFVLRRSKNEPSVAGDLPEKMEMKVFCNLSREQATLYQAVLDEMLSDIELSTGMRRRGLVLAALTRLKQICNHPACAGGEPQLDQTLVGRSGKCERLVEMLEEILAEDERALVFTQFRRTGELLEKVLNERLGREILFMHGGTPSAGRDAMVQRFQSDDPQVPVFLMSLKTGGFGLNLTSAAHVFHYDRWWNPAVEDQASDRAHRIGQTRRVQIHKFVCVGTLEERIDEMLQQKRELADQIVGSGEQWLTEMSTRQLREVLALSQDAVAED